MLKVLLAPLISADLLKAPRRSYRNASELAEAAEVSVMSAFRFVRQLRKEGFLDPEDESLHLVSRERLMRVWQAAYVRSLPELPLRWIIPAKSSFTGTDLGLLRLVRLRGLLFPDARRLEHPSHWKNTLP